MKTGAASLSILQDDGFLVENAGTTLGLGWLGALLVLSGSPIAATALTLVAGGEQAGEGAQRFTELQGFTMLTGSRLGAAFVVLVTAAIFAFRAPDGERKAPVTCAMFCALRDGDDLHPVPPSSAQRSCAGTRSARSSCARRRPSSTSSTSRTATCSTGSSRGRPALVFLLGLGCLLLAFKLVDTVLPTLDATALHSSRADWLTRKWPMFLLGCAVALVMMSVSVALTVLVPLVAKRYVKVDHVLPYIMGANITTLGDTMLAAFALDSPSAVRIVLAEVIATSVLSLVVLAFFYQRILKSMWQLQVLGAKSPRRLATFTAVLFLIPVTIILVSASSPSRLVVEQPGSEREGDGLRAAVDVEFPEDVLDVRADGLRADHERAAISGCVRPSPSSRRTWSSRGDRPRPRPRSRATVSHEQAHAGEQLVRVERLHEVVVGSHPEPGDAVERLHAGPGHEHDRERPVLRLAQPPADLVAGEPRETDVQEDDVGVARRRESERLLPGARLERLVLGVGEQVRHQRAQAVVVVDDQDRRVLSLAAVPRVVPPPRRVPAEIFPRSPYGVYLTKDPGSAPWRRRAHGGIVGAAGGQPSLPGRRGE